MNSLSASPLLWLVPAALGLGLTARPVAGLYAPDAKLHPLFAIAVMLLAAAWAFMTVPQTIALAASLLLAWLLFVLGTIDRLTFRLPNPLTFAAAALGLALVWLIDRPALPAHLAGGAIGFAALAGVAFAYQRLRGREGLGLGDAKLAGVGGAWLGWLALPSLVLVAAAGGLILYAIAALRGGTRMLDAPIPFGIPLGFAIWLVWLYGPLV